jgi:shikimate dehydrogenase
VSARCGVVLHPAAHTLSPVLHQTAYRLLDLDATYEVFDIAPAALTDELLRLRERGFAQLAISLPHKESVLALADSVSPAAQAIGAANTLTAKGERVEADNTDWIGVVKTLEPLGPWSGKRATVLGAGGAARGIVYALHQLGLEVAVVNRTRERAEKLVADLGGSLGRLEDPCDLLVNATPVGMSPDVDATPAPAESLHPHTTVFDAVYRPLETRLLREASTRGCRTVDGLWMLIHQAIAQLELWTHQHVDPAPLRAAALRALHE